ncbi:MAG: hypothetical protein A2487_09175 [Candidatus Raymondbacteria bacterium RifOxyC12_full_50_8]|uniref:Uroporphyrinogen decarboxylase (URO-D) domain-containing protein n=1 Tax=Candidatus Raymondbacteria bacterium RIFOXYD12_FULL_49_13 TaxID=1817890 RepID=A0A1F7FFK5_UNCRA|nr:MAG: hypothetical protein A2248_22765 [Candidatus Raymondbacteria bacterium RIFOXYA2_FULL_49_16]OGJ94591.1 MAG: hypothetical protein A2350_05905 [Candidatus Raymondbacteria bacterium RifOxyB12_full_50_8]OGJ98861.1 MAG: hypothetical protein A2487_09175 [Candidatus Raymondbacteria bacterium RifOxyC12_full_50_8]OGK05388.1 MAG: hypothetical protein A2519_03715 [Candidatus Raymondbacteria bacterium RIFOXYD12_FULL_49_13]OGP43001.1 MAG: hypothetical protein A2324_16420 [Candidatus Raymondbacteria b
MTPKEIVQATLDFAHPERVAHSFPESDLIWTRETAKTISTDWRKVDATRWERTDEWGNTWARIDPTSKGEVVQGVLDSLDSMDAMVFPDYSRTADFEQVRADRAAHPHAWLIGSVPGFTFNVARKLRRIDQYLMDILIEPEKIKTLHNRVDAVLEPLIRNYAAAGADSIMFPEDWGTQTATFTGPDLWREEFFPRTKKLCALAHSLGLKVFMHSCGAIGEIIPGLCEAGIDALQFDQPELHGFKNLAAYQKNHQITFWSPVDIQKTLQTKNEAAIRQAARDMLDTIWKGRGGFIAGFYGDNESIGLEQKWQEIASDEFLKWGTRQRYA